MRNNEDLVLLLETLQTSQTGSRALDMRVVSELGLADSETGVRSAGDVICFRLRPTASTDRYAPWLPDPTPTQSIDHALALSQLVLGEGHGVSLIQMQGQDLVQAEIIPGIFTEAATIPLAILATTVETLVSWKRAEESENGDK